MRRRFAPAVALRGIDVEPIGTMSYELADGTIREYPYGLVQVEVLGEVTAGRVVFGPDDGEPLLGVTALESIGLTIDPASQSLKRLPAIPLKENLRPVRRTARGDATVESLIEALIRGPRVDPEFLETVETVTRTQPRVPRSPWDE